MHFTPATALVAFVSVAAASPLAFPQNAGTGAGASNTCGVSSFVAVTGKSESPVLDDCYKMRDQASKSGPWKIDGAKTLATFGTCSFSAQPVTSGQHGYIGNSDIHDLVEDAIKRWQTSGQSSATAYRGTITKQVGSAGEMPCGSDGGVQVQISWTLGHS
ncbi:Putative Ecp2 effector protein [Septoria linicola]|uniref:Ecp2 effector protein n=1 Tax=Septoria linicola TaxID=215465 RepID=A0A9Q9AT42_9PEZI|nr:putative Ecp2 effector protein [Septoria linicola]USW51522.1 Putative Ecp2 effector protein [Septoria linicola]